MIKSKVVSINKNIRKFWVTHCNVCSGIDGAVEQIKTYNSDRDRAEWVREGRKVTEYTQAGKTQIPWCTCPFEDDTPTNTSKS